MIVEIRRGIGSPGKLWTGNIPEEGTVVNARIIERKCSVCEATTRRLRTHPVEDADAIAAACEVPILFVTMGGVGSIITSEGTEDLQLWNWSERVGGHAILNPVAVLNGYWNPTDLPPAKPGHRWIQTYSGSTLSEFVLIREKEDKPAGGEFVHALPLVVLEGKCPPCRHKEEMEATPEGLLVTHEHFAKAGVPENEFRYVLAYLGFSVDAGGSIPARTLLGYAQGHSRDTEEKYRAAIKAASEATTPPIGDVAVAS